MTHFGHRTRQLEQVYLLWKLLRSYVLLTDRPHGFRSVNVSYGVFSVRTVIQKFRVHYDSVMPIPSLKLLIEERRLRFRSSRIVSFPTASN